MEIWNNENNQATIIGKFAENFTYSHEVLGEKFFRTTLKVNRLSTQTDLLPVTISERLLDITGDYIDQTAKIIGQIRSYNDRAGGVNRVLLSVFAQEIELLEDFTDARQNQKIYLNGFLCKPPVFRITPLGREVVDLLIAVNRAYGKSDYIPTIAWGRAARYLSRFEVGCHIELRGRFQSREYYKNHEDGTQEVKTAYEVSAGWVK